MVNSHAHFDHAGGLGAAVAEGATILTHLNNEPVLERLLQTSGRSSATAFEGSDRRTDVVQAIADRGVRKGTNGKVVELHHVPNEHSDGYAHGLPAGGEAVVDGRHHHRQSHAVQLGTVKAAVAAFDRLALDYNSWLPAHPPNPTSRYQGGRDGGGRRQVFTITNR